MVNLLNKFASFIAIGIIAYLTYSSVNEASSSTAAVSKEMPVITKKMVSPEFIEPQSYASPADRDPFSAGWDKYVDPMAAMKQFSADSAASDKTVDFPVKLMGILSDSNGQRIAMIGSEVYGVGSSVKVPDSNELWQVNSIESESVILTQNGLRAVIKIADDYNDSNDSNNVPKGNPETKGQMESAK